MMHDESRTLAFTSPSTHESFNHEISTLRETPDGLSGDSNESFTNENTDGAVLCGGNMSMSSQRSEISEGRDWADELRYIRGKEWMGVRVKEKMIRVVSLCRIEEEFPQELNGVCL